MLYREYQTSAAVQMRSSIFWDFTYRRSVVGYRRYGQPIGHIVKGQAVRPLKMGVIVVCSEVHLKRTNSVGSM
jgi:hypothetical protein